MVGPFDPFPPYGSSSALVSLRSYCVAHTHDGESTQPVFIVCFNMANMDTIATMLISKGIMMLISVFFLLVTLYIYYIIPDLRETQDKVTSAAVGSLAVFMFLLSLVQLWVSLTHTPFCTVIGRSTRFTVTLPRRNEVENEPPPSQTVPPGQYARGKRKRNKRACGRKFCASSLCAPSSNRLGSVN